MKKRKSPFKIMPGSKRDKAMEKKYHVRPGSPRDLKMEMTGKPPRKKRR